MTPLRTVPPQCRKCGHPRSSDTVAPDSACPNCGAIYAKVEAQFKAREAAAVEREASVQLSRDAAVGEKQHAGELGAARAQVRKTTMLAHVVYLLFALPLGFTPIVGVVIAHAMRTVSGEPWLQSHFRWQIATFWWTVFWVVLFFGLSNLMRLGVTSIFAKLGNVVGVLGLTGASGLLTVLWLALAIWVLYRIVKGWVYLFKGYSL